MWVLVFFVLFDIPVILLDIGLRSFFCKSLYRVYRLVNNHLILVIIYSRYILSPGSFCSST